MDLLVLLVCTFSTCSMLSFGRIDDLGVFQFVRYLAWSGILDFQLFSLLFRLRHILCLLVRNAF